MKLIRNLSKFTILTILTISLLLIINLISCENSNTNSNSKSLSKTSFQSLIKNLKTKVYKTNNLGGLPKKFKKMRKEFKAQVKTQTSDQDMKCKPNDDKCVYDYKVINAAFKIYRNVNQILKIKSKPVLYDVDLRNRIGKPSTFVMNEIGLGGNYAKGSSALFR